MVINIIGGGFGWEQAPYEGICWGVNKVVFKRDVNVMFDMHDHENIRGQRKLKCLQIAAMCRDLKIPTFSVCADSWYMSYPFGEVSRYFNTEFFSNGICYMIALAIYQGATEINLYGVNHNAQMNIKEYLDQKPGVDFWYGLAKGLGIKIKIHGMLSHVGKTSTRMPYGYEHRIKELCNG